MQTQSSLTRLVARLLIVTTTSAGVTPGVHAAAIDTAAAVVADRERILVLLDRPDVSAQLEAYGVKPADAKARLAVLTDAEVTQLAVDIENAPAGGFIQIIAVALVGFAYMVMAAVAVVAMAVGGVIKLISVAANRGNSDSAPPAPDTPATDAVAAEPDVGFTLMSHSPISPSTMTSSPLPAAGDTWTYRLTEPNGRHPQARTHLVRIASVTPDTIVEQHPDEPGAPMRSFGLQGGYLTREGAVSVFSPYFTPYDAPASAAHMAYIKNFHSDSCGARWICVATASVSGKEFVRVPAGQFEAIKVEVQHTWTARYPNAESGTRVLSIWYSPQTKRAVKFSGRGTGRSSIHADFDLELESYSLN